MNNNKSKIYFFLVSFLVLIGISTQTVNARSFNYNDTTEIYLLGGQSSVKANELVIGQPFTYPVDYKLSQLIWDSREISTIVAGINIDFETYYTLNIEGRFGVDEGKGVMDNYDWKDIGNDWSDWSHHEDTSITELSSFDINVDYNLLGKGKKRSKLSLLAGYRDETWAWDSRGGSYIYSTLGILRDNIGTFTSGQRVITYEQRFKMPYLGLKYEGVFSSWKFNFQFGYSNQVDVSAIDHHILRDLIFKDDFAKGEMNAYKIGIGYKISKNFDLDFRYDVKEYEEVRGNTVYYNSSTGAATGYCLNCAGADNSNETWSIGASYRY